jgi:hypothetical protein
MLLKATDSPRAKTSGLTSLGVNAHAGLKKIIKKNEKRMLFNIIPIFNRRTTSAQIINIIVKKKSYPWLTKDIKTEAHGLVEDILSHSATPSQFEEICERIKNVDEARQEREDLIGTIYELIGIATCNSKKTKSAALERVYKAFWRLEKQKL